MHHDGRHEARLAGVNHPMKHKTIRVCVTAKDIAAGVRRTVSQCPIAHAVRRRIKDEDRLWVSSDLVSIGSGCIRHLPDAAIEFIDRFDAGRKVTPFVFALEVPAALLREAAR